MGKFHPFSHFNDVVTLFRNIPYPDVYTRWKEDEEFGRQAVQGYDPIQLHQWTCTSTKQQIQNTILWKKFPVTDQNIGWNTNDLKLQELFALNKLYYIDYFMLENMECWDDLPPKKFNTNGKRPRYCAASIALFYIDSQKRLMPCAIQMSQNSNLSPIFSPFLDTKLDWLLAKMIVQNSGANLHQMISHAMKTHLISEPFVIAAERNLAHCHPLYKILKRHTRYTLAINTKARNGLIDAGKYSSEESVHRVMEAL